jgi:hypothetical protein
MGKTLQGVLVGAVLALVVLVGVLVVRDVQRDQREQLHVALQECRRNHAGTELAFILCDTDSPSFELLYLRD